MKKVMIEIPDDKYERIKGFADDVTDHQTTLMLYKAVRDGEVIDLPTAN